jgi:hypothetical protein
VSNNPRNRRTADAVAVRLTTTARRLPTWVPLSGNDPLTGYANADNIETLGKDELDDSVGTLSTLVLSRMRFRPSLFADHGGYPCTGGTCTTYRCSWQFLIRVPVVHVYLSVAADSFGNRYLAGVEKLRKSGVVIVANVDLEGPTKFSGCELVVARQLAEYGLARALALAVGDDLVALGHGQGARRVLGAVVLGEGSAALIAGGRADVHQLTR